ncbi:MAG: hypothetical protein PUD50_02460 [Eubacteriales bacterium]|nr:hypothetical protein [Eubacteriales bacterium]
MDFDSEGVLWYAVFGRNCSSGRHEIGMPSSLFHWDIARGGKPEWMGTIGTKTRAACWTSEICISKDDMMYIIGSNHATDGPDITAVDLKAYRPHMYDFGSEVTEDAYYINPPTERYGKIADALYEQDEFGAQNNWRVPYELACEPTRLWRALAPDNIESSAVLALEWTDEKTLVGLCGGKKHYLFETVDGRITRLEEVDPASPEAQRLLNAKAVGKVVGDPPYYPGRQYKAVATAQADMQNGKTVVGTLDGMLAVCDGEKVLGLGPAAYNGPIRDLCATPDGKQVYGVGGDEDDLGMVFRYDEETGLRWLGHVTYDAPSEYSTISCPIITRCTISPDGKRLAIGSGDRLGQIIYYALS